MTQPSSNARDVDLECIVIDGVFVAKELIHEPLPRYYLSGIRHQQFEQTKLSWWQFDSLASNGYRLGGNVHGHVANLNLAGRPAGLAANHSPQTRLKFAQIKRLHQVV